MEKLNNSIIIQVSDTLYKIKTIFHASIENFRCLNPSSASTFDIKQKRNNKELTSSHKQNTWYLIVRLHRCGIAYKFDPIVLDFVLWLKTDVAFLFFYFMIWLLISTMMEKIQNKLFECHIEYKNFRKHCSDTREVN